MTSCGVHHLEMMLIFSTFVKLKKNILSKKYFTKITYSILTPKSISSLYSQIRKGKMSPKINLLYLYLYFFVLVFIIKRWKKNLKTKIIFLLFSRSVAAWLVLPSFSPANCMPGTRTSRIFSPTVGETEFALPIVKTERPGPYENGGVDTKLL